jgi:peptidylprolyl isomerase
MNNKNLITIGIIFAILTGIFFLLSQKPANITSDNSSQLQISPTIKPDMSQLKTEDLKIGTGTEVKSGDTVIMHYSGTLEDGTKFDSSYDRGQPFTTQIGVGQVIQGWDLGVPGMKIGGKRKLTIPPQLGYGAQGAGGVIPPNATLVFEVELIDIKK